MNKLDQFDIESLSEDDDFEFKLAAGQDGRGQLPKSVWETYSAMANTDGGLILLGVKEDPKTKTAIVEGIVDVEKVTKEFWDGVNNPKLVSVNLLANSFVDVLDADGKKVIWIHVPQASRQQRPVYIGSNPLTGTYRRNYEGDYKCPPEVVKQMLGEQTNDTRDAVLLDNFGMDDISIETLQAYRQRFENRQPDHPFNSYDNIEFLRQIGGWGKDRQTGNEGLLLAGLLMFGKLRSILDALSNYIVDYQERPRAVTEMRWVDRVTTDFKWSGNLFDFYTTVINKLYADLKVPFVIEGDVRVENTPVHVALREEMVNTLIHADYSGTCSLLVVKRPDMFGFRNPGTLRLAREEVLRGGTSDCRNRGLQKMFQLVGFGEQAGSGMPKIFTGWESQHWKRPHLEVDINNDQTLLKLETAALMPEQTVNSLQGELGDVFNNLAQVQQMALVIAETDGCVTHARLKELTSTHPHDISGYLHELVQKQLLESDGAGRGTFYFRPGKHPIQDSDLGLVPVPVQSSTSKGASSTSKGVSSTSKDASSTSKGDDGILEPVAGTKRVSPQIMKEVIRGLCLRKPRTVKELQRILNRTANTVRKLVNEMCSDEILLREYPNIPNHPQQKYHAKGDK